MTITDIEVKVGDKTTGTGESDTIKTGEQLNIYYHFRLDNCVNYTTAASVQIKFPQQFVIEDTRPIPINVQEGEQSFHIANCTIQKDGNATIDFFVDVIQNEAFEYVEEAYIEVGGTFNSDQAAAGRKQTVEFNVSSVVLTKDLYFQYRDDLKPPEVLPTVEKSGKASTTVNTITWTMTMTNAGTNTSSGCQQ